MVLCITRGYEIAIGYSNFSCLLLCSLGSVEVMGRVKFSSPGSILGCNVFVVWFVFFFSVRTDFI